MNTKKLLLAVMTLLLPVYAMADASGKEGNLTWYYEDVTNTLTISGDGPMKELGGYNMHAWYSYRHYIKKVVITEGVTSIATYAFKDCQSLTDISLPDGIISIGGCAFEYCRLNSIVIPSSVLFFYDDAFRLSGISNFFITDIAAWCNITFGNSVFSQPYNLYLNDVIISDLVIPNSVTNINSGAFANCKSLTSVVISNNVEIIKPATFYGCSNLKSITIPGDITSIQEYAFADCTSLTSFNIPSSVKSIGRNAFEYCTALTSITIPNNIERIEDNTFSRCSCLKSISWSGNLTFIGDNVFYKCSELTSIYIPGSVKSIGSNVFQDCTNLSSVTIPSSVKSIGSNTFAGCNNVVLTIECQNVSTWFSGQPIKELRLGERVNSIEASAFANCDNLETIIIGKNVTSIGYTAFSRCSKIAMVKTYIEEPYWIDASVFEYALSGSTILYVPYGTKTKYQNTSCWNQFPSIIEMEKEIYPDVPIDGKCSNPKIVVVNGKIVFSCETPDVEYNYEITAFDSKSGKGNELSLNPSYIIKVYASKEGYENSETTTQEIKLTRGDVNGDNEVTAQDASLILQYISGKIIW